MCVHKEFKTKKQFLLFNKFINFCFTCKVNNKVCEFTEFPERGAGPKIWLKILIKWGKKSRKDQAPPLWIGKWIVTIMHDTNPIDQIIVTLLTEHNSLQSLLSSVCVLGLSMLTSVSLVFCFGWNCSDGVVYIFCFGWNCTDGVVYIFCFGWNCSDGVVYIFPFFYFNLFIFLILYQ